MDSVTVIPGVTVTGPAILGCLTKAITFDSSTLTRVVVHVGLDIVQHLDRVDTGRQRVGQRNPELVVADLRVGHAGVHAKVRACDPDPYPRRGQPEALDDERVAEPDRTVNRRDVTGWLGE